MNFRRKCIKSRSPWKNLSSQIPLKYGWKNRETIEKRQMGLDFSLLCFYIDNRYLGSATKSKRRRAFLLLPVCNIRSQLSRIKCRSGYSRLSWQILWCKCDLWCMRTAFRNTRPQLYTLIKLVWTTTLMNINFAVCRGLGTLALCHTMKWILCQRRGSHFWAKWITTTIELSGDGSLCCIRLVAILRRRVRSRILI